jgi:hypothetical protein
MIGFFPNVLSEVEGQAQDERKIANVVKYPAAELRGIQFSKNFLPLDGGGLRWG